MSDTQAATPAQDVLDKAVAEGGAYEVLHKRLLEQGQRLRQTAERLNASRLEEFGDSQMDVIGRVRIRTENNCIARDIVQVGDCLLFGYNVFIGLRKETGVADVFSLYRLVEGSEGYEAEPVPLGDSFLAAPGFVNDFNELYTTRTPACCNWRSATASCWPASRSASGSPTSACSAGRSPATAAKSATSTTAASATSPCRHRSTSNGSGLPARWWWRAASRT